MDAFLVPPPADSDADADSAATEPTDSDATEHAAEPDENNDASNRDEDGNATEKAEHGAATEHACGDPSAVTREPPTKKQRTRTTAMSDEQADAATEHADYLEDDCDEALPPVLTVADATGKKQMFTKSMTHRDDWLHRGIMLRDMDYYHYSRYVERVEMPRSGSAQSFQKQHGVYHLFDAHYTRLQRPMSKYCSSKQRRCKTLGHNANDQMLMVVRTTPSIKHTSIRACIAQEPSSARTL